GRISAQTLEAGRVVASQSVKGGGKLFIRVFPQKSVTAIPAETRMGKGKGEIEYWAAVVKPGTVLYEITGLSADAPPQALPPRRPRRGAHQDAGRLRVHGPQPDDLTHRGRPGRHRTGDAIP